MNDELCLSVGGVLYTCTRSTLCSEPKSVLARMFNKDSRIPPAQSVDGVSCIDADPECFKIILTWLRRKLLVDLSASSVTVKQLLAEAEYFHQRHPFLPAQAGPTKKGL